MVLLIAGYPLVFWLGIATFASLLFQIFSGYMLSHGHPHFFKYHRANAMVIIVLAFAHAALALWPYISNV